MKVMVNREVIEIGEWANLTGDVIRRLAKVPADHDLWQRADYQDREYLHGPMVHDCKIGPDDTLFLSPHVRTAFFTAPTIINGSGAPTSVDARSESEG